jgi:PAP2 superfamily protein
VLLGWQLALWMALASGAVWLALRSAGEQRIQPWVGEITTMLLLFAAWQWGLGRFANHVVGGASHGWETWRLERWLHLPSEAAVQRAALRVPWVVRDLNYYYAVAHVQDVLICLLWLWIRHRDRYLEGRRALVLATGLSLLVQTIPVAPPRLLPATGVVDAGRLLGYSVYSPAGLHDASQLLAMPSVHCLFAAWVATTVVRTSTSRWRWLVVLHPILTISAVMLAGYHFWLDVVASEILVAVAVEVISRFGVPARGPILEPCPTP